MEEKFKFRGKVWDEITKMSVNEVSQLVNARARRSLKRGFTESKKRFLEQVKRFKAGKRKKPVRTQCRDIIITPDLVDMVIHVHNGKVFTPVKITMEMLGKYLGEFTMNRSSVKHSAPGIGATRSSAHQAKK